MNAFVIDDEKLTADLIAKLLTDTGEVKVTGVFNNPLFAFEAFEIDPPQAVFVDIEMPGISGLDLAEKLSATGKEFDLVFITAYSKYAIEAFKVNAIDYIMKPVLPSEIERVVKKLLKKGNTPPSKIEKKESMLRIKGLGGFEVFKEEQMEPISFFTAKSKELLAYLLVNGGSAGISKWKIIEALWADKDEKRGDANLRTTVYRLNKTLKENSFNLAVVSIAGAYKLNNQEIISDYTELERLSREISKVDSGNIEETERVLRFYKGEFFKGLDYSWLGDQTERHKRYFYKLLTLATEYRLQRKENLEESLNLVETGLQEDPFNEGLQELAFTLHYHTGGRAKAGAYFQDLAEMLRKELDIEPSCNIRECYKKLMK